MKDSNKDRQRKQPVAALPTPDMGGMQGEGNYAAARRFNRAESAFVAEGKVDVAALAAGPRTDAEAAEMLAAERAGKKRSKGEDPAVSRRAKDPVTTQPKGRR